MVEHIVDTIQPAQQRLEDEGLAVKLRNLKDELEGESECDLDNSYVQMAKTDSADG